MKGLAAIFGAPASERSAGGLFGEHARRLARCRIGKKQSDAWSMNFVKQCSMGATASRALARGR